MLASRWSGAGLMLLVLLGCAPALQGDDYWVTAHGRLLGYDGTRDETFPLAGARVQLMDSDCDGSVICDDVMGFSYVQSDGSFTVSGRGGDPGNYSWSRPDVYMRLVFNDDHGVRLTDDANNDQYFDTPEHDHNNSMGSDREFIDGVRP
jgi:hypothetical protein